MKDFVRFLSKILILLVALAIVDVLVGLCFKEIRAWSYKANKYSAMMLPEYAVRDLDADIVIIGASDASHSYIPSIITDNTGFTCYNLGRDGSFTVYQTCLINLLLEHYTPRIIIWEMMEECLSSDLPSAREYQSLKNLYSYYSENEYIKSIINQESWDKPLLMHSSMLVNNSTLMDYVNSVRAGRSGDNGYGPLPNTGYIYPDLKHEEGYAFAAPKKKALIQETIDKCQKHGTLLVFASAPKYSDNALKLSECYTGLKELASCNQVPFIDSERYQAAFNQAELYKDVAHLNDKGARQYMAYFIPELQSVMQN